MILLYYNNSFALYINNINKAGSLDGQHAINVFEDTIDNYYRIIEKG